MASLKDISYIQLHSCVIEGINVLKLQSKRTGIVVYLGQVEGPSVDGFICLGRYPYSKSFGGRSGPVFRAGARDIFDLQLPRLTTTMDCLIRLNIWSLWGVRTFLIR